MKQNQQKPPCVARLEHIVSKHVNKSRESVETNPRTWFWYHVKYYEQRCHLNQLAVGGEEPNIILTGAWFDIYPMRFCHSTYPHTNATHEYRVPNTWKHYTWTLEIEPNSVSLLMCGHTRTWSRQTCEQVMRGGKEVKSRNLALISCWYLWGRCPLKPIDSRWRGLYSWDLTFIFTWCAISSLNKLHWMSCYHDHCY